MSAVTKLFKKPVVQQAPTPVEVKSPMANTPAANVEQVDRSAADIMRRRRGTQATLTGAGSLGTTAGSVASKSLLGM